MKISIMVTTDDHELLAVARDSFDAHAGYPQDDLHKLYLQARKRLAMKLKKRDELEAKDGQKS